MRSTALLAALAVGAIAASATAATPRFDVLPFGLVGAVPRQPPVRIPASERAPGFFLEPVTGGGNAESEPRYVRLLAAPGSNDSDDQDACFEVLDTSRSVGQPSSDWPTTCETTPSIIAHYPAAQRAGFGTMHIGGVAPAHSERLVVDAQGNATLEDATAWVDPQTRGSRLLSHASLRLARLATGPGRVQVYALRGDRVVEFVVVGAEVPDFPATSGGRPFIGALLGAATATSFLANISKSLTRTLTATSPAGREGGSNVGFLRVALPARPGEGAAATVTTRVVLPPRKGEPSAARELRSRQLDVHLSVSQTSSDVQPVLSVGFGWNGKVQTQAF